MIRLALAALIALSLAVPGIATGQSGDSAGEHQATVAKKKKKASCKKGYVRKQVKVTKGPKKGKRVSKCVKKKGGKKKPAAPLVPDDPNSGGVYVGGSGPTELKILVGYGDGNGVSLRLTMPAGSMQCDSFGNPGEKVPSDQDVRTSYEGRVDRKTGAFSGSDGSGAFSRSMSGNFLPGKRIKAQVTLTNIQQGHSAGGACSGTATRDVTYKPGVAGTFSTP